MTDARRPAGAPTLLLAALVASAAAGAPPPAERPVLAPGTVTELPEQWRYSPDARLELAGPAIDDSGWPMVATRLPPTATPADWSGAA